MSEIDKRGMNRLVVSSWILILILTLVMGR